MNFKEKYFGGNNFVLSPRGKISRTRYFVYALILEILYRLLLSSGTVLGKEVSPILFFIGFLAIPIIILKLFNYKKRAYSFLNNNILAYLYSLFYMFIGAFMQEYLYLLELSNKKGLYELTQDPVFQQYANVYIPDFIISNTCHIVFNVLCGIGFIMFLLLIFRPTTKLKESIAQTAIREDVSSKVKNKVFNKVILIPSIILYFIFLGISYSEIHWRAYNWMHYYMSNEQVDYVNNIKKNEYDKKLKAYNESQKEWYDCLKKHPKLSDRLISCEMSPKVNLKPDIPTYFNYETGYLGMTCLDYFNCTQDKFSLFSNKCGDITFNNINREYSYGNFHPYMLLIIAVICLLPLCIFICLLIEKILTLLIKLIRKINIKEFKFKTKVSIGKKSNLSDKLQELNALKERGLITEEDYNNKKSQLLDEF